MLSLGRCFMSFVSLSTLAFLAIAAVGGVVIAVITWRSSPSPDTVAEILHSAEAERPAVPTTK